VYVYTPSETLNGLKESPTMQFVGGGRRPSVRINSCFSTAPALTVTAKGFMLAEIIIPEKFEEG
jgi:hypothetical protein